MTHVVRFPAVDGETVERAVLVERGVIAADLAYKDGSLGNALSHVALWDAAMRGNQSLTVCEDDAIFNYSFCAHSEKVLQQLPSDWHIILWGWNFDAMLWFDMIPGASSCIGWFEQDALRKGIDVFQTASLRPDPFRLLQAFGTICYSVSPNGARLLRQYLLPLRNTSIFIPGMNVAMPNNGIDAALNRVYSRLSSFVSVPPLVVTRNEHNSSTIQR